MITMTTECIAGMERKSPPPSNVYHHHRAPRTPESYFNVPESIALLNIVKSERIQSAFQSNRKNHASVWEMVAEVLNRYSARKRSAKQCCNRYENLKKIYTQLKKNPERHVRRNWPYMFLFKEIEEQRGECWGATNKRLALLSKNHNELSYYHRRRQAVEFTALLDKQTQAAVAAQQNLLQTLVAQSNDSSSNNSNKMERFIPNHFVETQLNIANESLNANSASVGVNSTVDTSTSISATNSNNAITVPLVSAVNGAICIGGGVNAVNVASIAASMASTLYNSPTPLALQNSTLKSLSELPNANVADNLLSKTAAVNHHRNLLHQAQAQAHAQAHIQAQAHVRALTNGLLESEANALKEAAPPPQYEKDCDGALNLQTTDNNNISSMKSEPMSDSEFNPDDIQLMQTNYNSQNFYNNLESNILHPDVIVDTGNLSDCSSTETTTKRKRKLSLTSTDGADSTNYELIEYLKRREKRDEELLSRMDAREERLLNLLERTVTAIESLSQRHCWPLSAVALTNGIANLSAAGGVNFGTTSSSSSNSNNPKQGMKITGRNDLNGGTASDQHLSSESL